MKRLDPITWEYASCVKQAQELESLLRMHPVLNERKAILPFFRKRPHLCALCGVYNPYLTIPDRIAWEFDLFGDFQCDLVVGNWATSYSFIEFEDAGPRSIFEKKGKKATLEWSKRFEHGYSQLIDWFYKIADREKSDECEAVFGKRSFEYEGVLIIGRDKHLGMAERMRLEWRRKHLVLNSKKIHCITFDELLAAILSRLSTLGIVAGARK